MGHCIIGTDQGGEFNKYYDFRKTTLEAKYPHDLTAPDAAFQKAVAKFPNQFLANMFVVHVA